MLGVILFFLYFDRKMYMCRVICGICTVLFLLKPNLTLTYKKCPQCFGDELCESIKSGEISLTWISTLILALNPNLTKSVFFAKVDDTIVVLKSMTRRSRSYASTVVGHPLNETVEKIIEKNSSINDKYIQSVILCPGLSSFDLIFNEVDESFSNIVNNKNLWLHIPTSIEPLLLKFLGSMGGMPVPKFYGACGDIIMTEFKGNSLYNYYTSHWREKVKLSFQLLEMAEIFTFRHPSLIFYFTDISPDNIVVDSSGSTFLVDLDHVIIAERTTEHTGDAKHWRNVHVSDLLDSTTLAFIPSEICKHSISDHNYFVVCQYILIHNDLTNNGLLNGVPEGIHKRYKYLSQLIDECGLPKKYVNRIAAGRELKKTLQEIIIEAL